MKLSPILLLAVLSLLMLAACQRGTYDTALIGKAKDAPKYSVEPNIHGGTVSSEQSDKK